MKKIYVIRENNEIITARDTMNNAVGTAMNRLSICGYMCEGFDYDENVTIIEYRDLNMHETRIMTIEEINYMEGI